MKISPILYRKFKDIYCVTFIGKKIGKPFNEKRKYSSPNFRTQWIHLQKDEISKCIFLCTIILMLKG